MSKKEFLTEIEAIRKSAREKIEQGAITEHYRGDLKTILSLLNDALATEILCTLRYKSHHFKASALGASVAAAEFLEHSDQERVHADSIAARMVQLGGEPNMNPDTLSKRSHADYVECKDIKEMIKENLIAERIAIDMYREMIQYIGNDDPTTRRLLEEILAVEEEHADDLIDLVAEYHVKF